MFDKLAKTIKNPVAWFGAAVFLLTLLPYLQTVGFDLVNNDDYGYVRCSPVAKGLSWENLEWAFGTLSYQAIWMPATWVSYMLDISLLGGGAGVHHGVNAALHAANAGLVFALLWLVLAETGWRGALKCREPNRMLLAAAFGALFWSLHPLRVESVAWIASRKDVLSLFWELLALVLWVKGLGVGEASRGGAEARGESAGAGAKGDDGLRPAVFRQLSLLCFAIACLSKPTAMTFPALAVLLEVLVRGKVLWQRLAVPAALALVCGAIAVCSQEAGGAQIMLTAVPLWGRLLNAVAAVGGYCWKTVWPTDLMVPYLHTWPALPAFVWPGLAICAGYAAALLWSLRAAWPGLAEQLPPKAGAWLRPFAGIAAPTSDLRPPIADMTRTVFAGLAWFLVAVAPTLGLANFGYHSHADRFTYLPGIGFAVLAAVGLARLFGCGRRAGLAAGAVGAAALVALGVASGRQAGVWRDDPALYTHTLAISKDNYVANRGLGIYYCGHWRNYAKAAAYFSEAFRTNREDNRGVQLYYIVALAGSGALDRAKEEARDLSEYKERQVVEAVNRGEDFGPGGKPTRLLDTFKAYGMIAYYEGDKDLARQHAETALASCEEDAYAHYILGLIARDENHLEEAIRHWKISAVGDVITLRPFLEPLIAELEKAVAAGQTQAHGSSVEVVDS